MDTSANGSGTQQGTEINVKEPDPHEFPKQAEVHTQAVPANAPPPPTTAAPTTEQGTLPQAASSGAEPSLKPGSEELEPLLMPPFEVSPTSDTGDKDAAPEPASHQGPESTVLKNQNPPTNGGEPTIPALATLIPPPSQTVPGMATRATANPLTVTDVLSTDSVLPLQPPQGQSALAPPLYVALNGQAQTPQQQLCMGVQMLQQSKELGALSASVLTSQSLPSILSQPPAVPVSVLPSINIIEGNAGQQAWSQQVPAALQAQQQFVPGAATTQQAQQQLQLQLQQARMNLGASINPALTGRPIQDPPKDLCEKFLDKAKEALASVPQKYTEFLGVLEKFREGSLQAVNLLSYAGTLFQGRPDLFEEFQLIVGIEVQRLSTVRQFQQAGTAVLAAGAAGSAYPAQPLLPAVQSSPAKRPELDQARNYVKKIKQRFSDSPQIYKTFLSILHKYHRENKTFNEVFEQISELFKGQDDLLREFMDFLPDETQPTPSIPQAQPQLQQLQQQQQQITAQQQQQLSAQQQQQQEARVQSKAITQDNPHGLRRTQSQIKTRGARLKDKEAFKTESGTAADSHQLRSDRLKRKREDDKPSPEFRKATSIFTMVRRTLPKKAADDVVKVLQLFSKGVVTPEETSGILEPVLREEQALLNRIRDALSLPPLAPFADACPKCGQLGSYQMYKPGEALEKCSARGALENSVLNDTYFSSERTDLVEPFQYRRMHQEVELIDIDDERHDLDLYDEQNTYAIRCLDGIQRRLDGIPSEEAAALTLTREEAGGAVCLGAISRVYGDRKDHVIRELLKNPAATVPFVKARLEAVRAEYGKTRHNANKLWRAITEQVFGAIIEQKIIIASDELSDRLKPRRLLGPCVLHLDTACAGDAANVVLAMTRKTGVLPGVHTNPKNQQPHRFVRDPTIGVFPTTKTAPVARPPLVMVSLPLDPAESKELAPRLEGILGEVCDFITSATHGGTPNGALGLHECPERTATEDGSAGVRRPEAEDSQGAGTGAAKSGLEPCVLYGTQDTVLLVRCFCELVDKVSKCKHIEERVKSRRERNATAAENATSIPGHQRVIAQGSGELYDSYLSLLKSLRAYGFTTTAVYLQELLRVTAGHAATVELATAMVALDNAALHLVSLAKSKEGICLLALRHRRGTTEARRARAVALCEGETVYELRACCAADGQTRIQIELLHELRDEHSPSGTGATLTNSSSSCSNNSSSSSSSNSSNSSSNTPTSGSTQPQQPHSLRTRKYCEDGTNSVMPESQNEIPENVPRYAGKVDVIVSSASSARHQRKRKESLDQILKRLQRIEQ